MRQLKMLLATMLGVSILGLAGGTVAAQGVLNEACSGGGADSAVCQDEGNGGDIESNGLYGPDGILTRVTSLLAIVIGVASVIVIIVAGIQYMISTGEPGKVNGAKNAILYAIVGLLVALLAEALARLVISQIGI